MKENIIRQFLQKCFVSLKNALGYHGDKGLLSSLMGWIVAGNITPSFIEGNALSGEVCILCGIFAVLIKTLSFLYYIYSNAKKQ